MSGPNKPLLHAEQNTSVTNSRMIDIPMTKNHVTKRKGIMTIGEQMPDFISDNKLESFAFNRFHPVPLEHSQGAMEICR